MISVKCVNPDCTAPEKKFDWYGCPDGWIIADPSDLGAEKFIAICTCKKENTLWLKPSNKRNPPRKPGKGIRTRVRIPLSPGIIDIPMKFISRGSKESRINYTKSGNANERQSKKN